MSTTREPIFSTSAHTDGSPARNNESTFEFFDRVAGAFWEHPRQLMQSWADHITGEEDYYDLRQRFRSRDNDQFRSAFLELYLHECLIRAGYSITVHPDVPGTSRRPDFYAERADTSFYLEAIAPGTQSQAKSAAKRRADIFDYVNKLEDPNFFLGVVRLQEGPSSPPVKKLSQDLKKWLASLDPDDYADFGHAPRRDWTHESWAATFTAFPKKPEARGKPSGRAIGLFAYSGATGVDDAPAIRDALATKHHAYGDLDAPFVIAVGTYIHDSDRWHSSNAMYGHEAYEIYETGDRETLTQQIRQSNGYFGTPPNWQNRNVSGVLLVNQLMPDHADRAETTLWRHPNPLHPLPECLGFPAVTVALDGTTVSEAQSPINATSFFGLSDPWPPGEPWPKTT